MLQIGEQEKEWDTMSMGSNIVAAYDGSELSEKALRMAKTLLEQDPSARLHIVMVINMRSIVHRSGLSLTDIDQLRARHFQEAEESLKEAREQFQSLPNEVKALSLEGEPGRTIVDYIRENEIDLAILGSRGLSGLQELFLGSVSHYVVQKSPCPVLIVK